MPGKRFTSNLFLCFGPLFVVGGYLAAFTVEGALLIFIGAAMFITGLLLRTRLPVLADICVGVALLAAMTANMVRELG